jgi:putative transposase
VRYRFISEHRTRWSVEEMCRILKVSRSGFYAWQRRGPSARAVETGQLDAAIRRLSDAHRGRPGSPKMTRLLAAEGWHVSESRVARRMRRLGLRAIVRRAWRVTTDSRHRLPVAPNRLARCFTAQGPNQVWVSDLTYLRTRQGWLYLVVILDLYSRQVVGWALSDSLRHPAVLKALRRAIDRRRPARGLVFHSDRGIQYACEDFVQALVAQGCVQSMSRKGDVWDNAVAESFFHLLKSELVYHVFWDGYADAHRDLFEYIEIYYNRERLHSTLGYLSPAQFERQSSQLAA